MRYAPDVNSHYLRLMFTVATKYRITILVWPKILMLEKCKNVEQNSNQNQNRLFLLAFLDLTCLLHFYFHLGMLIVFTKRRASDPYLYSSVKRQPTFYS
nr:unnamed protein product [Callosobruchus chinensis]